MADGKVCFRQTLDIESPNEMFLLAFLHRKPSGPNITLSGVGHRTVLQPLND